MQKQARPVAGWTNRRVDQWQGGPASHRFADSLALMTFLRKQRDCISLE